MKKGRFLLYILIHSSIHHSYRLSFAPLPFFYSINFLEAKYLFFFSQKKYFSFCVFHQKQENQFMNFYLFYFILFLCIFCHCYPMISYVMLLCFYFSFLFVNIHLFYLQSMHRLSYSCKIYPFYFYFFFKSMKNIERGQESKEENQIKNIMIKCDMKRNEKDEGENVPWNNNNL